jgi:hypothetical protein
MGTRRIKRVPQGDPTYFCGNEPCNLCFMDAPDDAVVKKRKNRRAKTTKKPVRKKLSRKGQKVAETRKRNKEERRRLLHEEVKLKASVFRAAGILVPVP